MTFHHFSKQVCFYVTIILSDNKRKGDEGLDNPSAKTKKLEKRKCTDLIVMGLPWRATDSEMRRHFEEYGPLVLCSVKRDPKSGDSRGFGFIRFQDYDAQVMCLANRHFIEGRWCDVKIPNSRVSGNTISYFTCHLLNMCINV